MPDGSHLDQVGGSGCQPLDELPDGTVLCFVGQSFEVGHRFEVRRSSGELLWQQNLGQSYLQYQSPWLSPDGMRIAGGDAVFTRTGQPASGARIVAPVSSQSTFSAQGWLDTDTIVAGSGGYSQTRLGPGGPLFLVDAAQPSQARPLAVSGIFEGTLNQVV